MLKRLEYPGCGLNKGRFYEMSNDDEPVILGFGVHAVVGLDVLRLEDRVFRVEDVLLPEDLHINNQFYQVNQSQMEIQASLNHDYHKSDQVFYKAFTTLHSRAWFIFSLQAVKLLVFISLIPYNIVNLNVSYGRLIITFILNSVASAMGLAFMIAIIIGIYRSLSTFLLLSEQTNHSVEKEPLTNLQNIQNCVSSTIYIGENQILESDLDEEGRKLNLNIAKNAINSIMRKQFPWVKNLENFYSLMSFFTMIYSIITLVADDMAVVDTWLLSIYVVVVGLTQLPLVCVVLLIFLSPLIFVVLIIACCCCSANDSSQSNFIDLASSEATTNDIVNAGGDCSICYMSIAPQSKIFVLPCSEKHIFHSTCLRHWAKVKNTCPICRAEIPMTNVSRQSQSESQGEGEREGGGEGL